MDGLRPSRRRVLAGLSGTAGGILLGRERLWAAGNDARLAGIAAKNIIVDMHSHVQIAFTRNPADAAPVGEIDLAGEMRRSGFSAVCQTYDMDGGNGVPAGNDYGYYLQSLGFEDQLLKHNQMRRALTLKDLETAHAERQPIIVQSVEGAQFIEGRMERIEEAYRRGLRHMQPVHERDDTVKPLGDVYTAPVHLGGLTVFGAEVIRECNRLGIVVDLAHGTEATVRGALKAATQPLIISHTSLAKETDNEDMRRRLISKDLARAVAEAGGIVGVWWRMSKSVQDYVGSVRAMADAIGVEHVGIGTDTDLTASYVLPTTNQIWPDENGGFFYAVAGEMLKAGFSAEEIGRIGGGNFCRLFGEVQKVAG
jgi:membrane dipeptidase